MRSSSSSREIASARISSSDRSRKFLGIPAPPHSDADEDVLPLDPHLERAYADHFRFGVLPCLDVEPPAVPGAGHDVSGEVALPQVAAHVGAGVPDRVEGSLTVE